MLQKSVIKHIHELQQKKYRNQSKEFLVEGMKGVLEAVKSEAEVILVIIEGSKRDIKDIKDIIRYCDIKNVPYEFCGRLDVDKIKTTETFSGVMAVVAQPDVMLEDVIDNTPIICLDGVKDPGNLGTIIRTADWFGVKNIILSEDSVEPYNDKVVRSTMGSIFRVRVHESAGLVRTLGQLKKEKYEIVGLVMNGQEMGDKKIRDGRCVYVFGSESHGVRPEVEKLLDKKYTISGKGGAESLNVAVACGIVLHSL